MLSFGNQNVYRPDEPKNNGFNFISYYLSGDFATPGELRFLRTLSLDNNALQGEIPRRA